MMPLPIRNGLLASAAILAVYFAVAWLVVAGIVTPQ